MNRKRILDLADDIERLPHLKATKPSQAKGSQAFVFSMENYYARTFCATVGCIAGFAYSRAVDKPPETLPDSREVRRRAAEYLELNPQEEAILFEPKGLPIYYRDLTPGDAARALRALADDRPLSKKTVWKDLYDRSHAPDRAPE